jgi:hypothetical protein
MAPGSSWPDAIGLVAKGLDLTETVVRDWGNQWSSEPSGPAPRQNTMRWRSWLLLSASVVIAAAGAGLPWAHNPLVAERSGLTVMFGDRASAPATLVLLGALTVVLAGIVAATVYRRRMFAWTAIAGGLTALSCVSWHGIQIAGERVRAFGVDSAGNLIEPEAASRLGIGWYLTGAALLTLTVLAIGLRRPARTIA